MFIAFTAPLALLGLDFLFLGILSLICWLAAPARGSASALLWQHAKITVGAQLALGLLVLALEVGLDLNALAWTKFFGLIVFGSAFLVPLVLYVRHYRQRQP